MTRPASQLKKKKIKSNFKYEKSINKTDDSPQYIGEYIEENIICMAGSEDDLRVLD